ncbi:hypothetical protein C485_12613 [Natrinema altunense JCM 12890]|uniref:Uncharacterized protein n=1 Tax=Natrinema altunense (strain JCM 12890 / CGMCC 1.3731 / AJ2) TaxID=1227494 RepID=L9ZH11_NATA2|nr:hypothetical protein C485_12613 [Natrinema altunense JCM 12890]
MVESVAVRWSMPVDPVAGSRPRQSPERGREPAPSFRSDGDRLGAVRCASVADGRCCAIAPVGEAPTVLSRSSPVTTERPSRGDWDRGPVGSVTAGDRY